MPKKYYFYAKNDWQQEPISRTVAPGRLSAAKYFAGRKNLTLKDFLNIYSVSR
jgi:hypothetical protein